jgi:UDP-N-acetylmuramoyl-tripeptide--D-alanyl-D-alanine ligase
MLNLGHIIEGLTGYQTIASVEVVTDVVVDSRSAIPGSLFVAFPGECVDGHDFVLDAFDRGAVAALVERPVGTGGVVDVRQPLTYEMTTDLHLPVCIVVGNTLEALQQLATYWRARHSVRVIGITGSVGKTTTKELTHAVLSARYRTLKSEGNLNNEIGLPLTLMHLTDAHERVVLEMGMYVGGEISTLVNIARPQVGVVTNIGPVHMERAGTIRAIADAKAELVEALPPAPQGVAILNQDEHLVREMAGRTQARVFTYGLSEQADLWADHIEGVGLDGIRFSLHYQGETVRIRAPLLGRHSVHTALRAAAVGLVEGLGWEEIVSGLQGDTPQLRLVAVHGPNGSLLLDDTYNASPASTIAALNLLAELPAASPAPVAGGRRVAVLGDMLELGAYEQMGHRLVGRRVIDAADLLVTVGSLGRIIAEESLAGGMPEERVIVLPDVEAAKDRLPAIIRQGDVVLIKGSRGVRLDQLVDSLTQESADVEPAGEECG